MFQQSLHYLVAGDVTDGVLHLHHHEGVEEVGGDHVRDEGRGLLLEHHRHDVVSYVTFPLELEENMSDSSDHTVPTPPPAPWWYCLVMYLLRVSLCEGQLGGHVEHDLLVSVDGVDRLRPRLTVGNIQTSTEPAQEKGAVLMVRPAVPSYYHRWRQ